MQTARQTQGTGVTEIMPRPKDLRARCLRPGDAADAALAAIEKAERAMEQLSVNFGEWMLLEVRQLAAARDAARAENYAPASLEGLFHCAHDLKGQAGTLGYPFAADVCASLCRLLDTCPDKVHIPRDLIDQHVDAVRAIVREGATGTDHPMASVLTSKLRDVAGDFLAREEARVQARQAGSLAFRMK